MEDRRLAYARNRAEEFGRDVWEEFVVPLFFDNPEVRPQRKSMVIIGGRGCGKTTLLRYFSHSTKFSSRRTDLSQEDLAYVGLYLRADTNFLSTLRGGDITVDVWASAFRHSLACDLGLELVSSLRSINCTESRIEKFGKLEELNFAPLQDFDPAIGTTLDALEKHLISTRDRLAAWVNNLDSMRRPHFLAGERFLKRLVEIVQQYLPYLKQSIFSVFIDEYENLHEYQQEYINGLIKHSEAPLVINVAMKRNGMRTTKTAGNETIQHVADFREINLEEELSVNFELFAAELLFFRLVEEKKSTPSDVPIDVAVLRDVDKVSSRLTNAEYRHRVLSRAQQMLPRLSERELAETAFRSERIQRRVRQNIENGLKNWSSKLEPEAFIKERIIDASLVSGALLSRGVEKPEIVLAELQKYEAGERSQFKEGEWIKNNLVGVVLQLYGSGQTTCPVYAGFENFVLMSRSNIRSFLALIHEIFSRLRPEAIGERIQVSVEDQAEAVRMASSEMIRGVRASGPCANQLQGMALTLGATFRAKQQLVAQSEPEITHFHIQHGAEDLQLNHLLSEAIKWSVLYDAPETKLKAVGARIAEYILNPIFSAYFQISFRKKRSMALSTDDLKGMFEGTVQERDAIVRRLMGQDQASVNLELDLGA